MRKSTFGVALLVLVAIVWLGLQNGQPHADETNGRSQPMQQWEYHWYSTMNPQDMNALNELGDKGWEVCGVTTDIRVSPNNPSSSTTNVLLKRQKNSHH